MSSTRRRFPIRKAGLPPWPASDSSAGDSHQVPAVGRKSKLAEKLANIDRRSLPAEHFKPDDQAPRQGRSHLKEGRDQSA